MPGFSDPSQCGAAGYAPNVVDPLSPYFNVNAANTAFYPAFNPTLFPNDLTRGGSLYPFNGHTDVKELALYVRDVITTGNWSLNLGIRGDLYNGLSIARQAEPRLGISYNVKRTNTILRVSYARTLESPFNENLILSSIGCGNAVMSPLLALFPGSERGVESRLSQRIPRWPGASFRTVPGLFRRMDHEVHAQWLRFQCARQHPDHFPD